MATEIVKEAKKKGGSAWWILLLILPFVLIAAGYLLYRAFWTLSAMRYIAKLGSFNVFKQNNIQVATQWDPAGTQFQEGYYGGLGWNAATGKITGAGWAKTFFYGLPYIWALPYVLFSPGFYGGLFWNKNAPQNLS
jgi:hypothetical protein